MTRQRYSATESLNRILLLLQGTPIPTDVAGGVTGEVLSENEVLSDLAELLAGSLPNQNFTPATAMSRYGHMFAHNATGTVVVASADVYYAVSGGFNTGLVSGFTFANGMHLRSTLAGRYFVTYSVSVQSTSANQEIETAIMINSIAQTGSSAHTEDTGANKPHTLAGSMISDLAANSIVGLGVANHTGANNLLVAHGNVSIFMLAPYGG